MLLLSIYCHVAIVKVPEYKISDQDVLKITETTHRNHIIPIRNPDTCNKNKVA